MSVHAQIFELLTSGHWYTTSEIQGYLQIQGHRLMSESAVSARTRELRKDKYGSHKVICRPRVGHTAYEYRIQVEHQIAA